METFSREEVLQHGIAGSAILNLMGFKGEFDQIVAVSDQQFDVQLTINGVEVKFSTLLKLWEDACDHDIAEQVRNKLPEAARAAINQLTEAVDNFVENLK